MVIETMKVASVAVVLLVTAGMSVGAQAPLRVPPTTPPAEGPAFVEVVNAQGAHTRLGFDLIKKSSTGPIVRGGDYFEFTPLLAVMKLANLPPSARLRVTGAAVRAGSGDDMTLGKGLKFDPADFGFIFNRRGRPVLTPRPGTIHASAPVTNDRPQVRDVTTMAVVK